MGTNVVCIYMYKIWWKRLWNSRYFWRFLGFFHLSYHKKGKILWKKSVTAVWKVGNFWEISGVYVCWWLCVEMAGNFWEMAKNSGEKREKLKKSVFVGEKGVFLCVFVGNCVFLVVCVCFCVFVVLVMCVCFREFLELSGNFLCFWGNFRNFLRNFWEKLKNWKF